MKPGAHPGVKLPGTGIGDGADLLGQVTPIFAARQAAMRAALSAEEQATFDRLLLKIVYAMPDWVVPE